MKTVFVGLSGGVDSSVTALRLKEQGYNVVGVFIKVWQPDFLRCNWEQERLDAMRVAAHLEIPFLTCDAEEAYRIEVGEFFISEYQAGRTPNPDVMCNQHVKFGAFLDFALAKGADYVATGHYAQSVLQPDGSVELHRGVDQNKDQSYFLWTLTQTQLQKILFPVGDTPKEQIRQEAERAKIPVATKKDSQGVCFLGHIDIPEFLSHFVELVPGPVLDEEGSHIGEHVGALVYTVGQRHGFTITVQETESQPRYVIAKDLTQNTITVSTSVPQLSHTEHTTLYNTNWIPNAPAEQASVAAQFRYRQAAFSAIYANNTITPQTSVSTPATGQSCVLYEGSRCLGGGMIA